MKNSSSGERWHCRNVPMTVARKWEVDEDEARVLNCGFIRGDI